MTFFSSVTKGGVLELKSEGMNKFKERITNFSVCAPALESD